MKRIGVKSALMISAALVAGCAGMSAAECSSVNWYDLGFRDARLRVQTQVDLYAAQCERHGGKIDAARYDQGFREGRWEFPDRTPL
jgi:hypothetical protein